LSERIGHFSINIEIYLCEREKALHNKRTFDIFFHNSSICNEQLNKMWKRHPNMHIWSFAKWLNWVNCRLPGCNIHSIPIPTDKGMRSYNLIRDTKPHLSFTPDEEHKGSEELKGLGMPEGAQFVCFCTRDSSYLNAIFPQKDWSYHDFRDASIHNQLPAAEELARRGSYAIRMGAVVKETIKTTNPKVVDYARNGRSDFLDMYLCAKCRFFIACDVGINSVPRIFRKPIVYVNCIPLSLFNLSGHAHESLIIPKKLRFRKDGRFLTLRQMLEMKTDMFYTTEPYEQYGVEAVENTPEEITAAAIEMDKRLNGEWQTTEEDEKLQKHVWSMLNADELYQKVGLRIGAEFLRENKELFK